MMRWQAFGAVLTVHVLVSTSSFATDCELFVQSFVDCRAADWARWPDEELDSVDSASDLGELLDGLLEGRDGVEFMAAIEAAQTTEEKRNLAATPVPSNDCLLHSAVARQLDCEAWSCLEEPLEQLAETCIVPLLEALGQLAVHGSSRSQRLGALTMAFTWYMDAPPAPEHEPAILSALTPAANALLAPEQEALIHAATLKVMEFAAPPDSVITDRVALLMGSRNALVEVLAINTFYSRTGCALLLTQPRGGMPSPEQVRAAQAWWRERRSQGAADERVQR